MTGRRWAIAVIVAILVVGLVAFARGRDHHRGPQQVGAMADVSYVSIIASA